MDQIRLLGSPSFAGNLEPFHTGHETGPTIAYNSLENCRKQAGALFRNYATHHMGLIGYQHLAVRGNHATHDERPHEDTPIGNRSIRHNELNRGNCNSLPERVSGQINGRPTIRASRHAGRLAGHVDPCQMTKAKSLDVFEIPLLLKFLRHFGHANVAGVLDDLVEGQPPVLMGVVISPARIRIFAKFTIEELFFAYYAFLQDSGG